MLREAIYLDSYLAPIAPFLTRGDVTDIYVNRPGEVWLETLGGAIERVDCPELTGTALTRLARQIAAASAQGISREHPLLAASLPDGSRVQVIQPPATRDHVAMAFRKHVAGGLSLDDYARGDGFAAAGIRTGENASNEAAQVDSKANHADLLRQAVLERKNILISGGTSTGKTTFLNALLGEIPLDERIIAIEDTPELRFPHENAVGLLAVRGAMGESSVTAEDLLIASLRMRPDRIILGEMRGLEAMTFLRAVNTGHPGSLSTIHADSAERAIDQLALLILQSGTRMGWDDVIRYVRRSLDVIVHLRREGGKRVVDEILLV